MYYGVGGWGRGINDLTAHSAKFLFMKCLILSSVILLPILLCGDEDFSLKVQRIAKQTLVRKEIPLAEGRLMVCLNESSTTTERGIVYAAIAGVYSHDLQRCAVDAIRYAQKALTNELGIVEACQQHLIVACAQDVLLRNGKIDDGGRKKALGGSLVRGLSFVLDHLPNDNDKRVPLTSVGKFELDSSDPLQGELERHHAEQLKIRNTILLQNKLIDFRDEFSFRLIGLYGENLMQQVEFCSLLDDVCAIPAKKRRIMLCIRRKLDDAKVH